jgi:hypothetical protein
MARTEAVTSQIKATLRERRRAAQEGEPLGNLPFITVSRQTGAGGRSLARAILAEFEKQEGEPRFRGWSSYDEELCKTIVADPEIRVSLAELVAENYRSPGEDYVSVLLGGSFQDEIQKKIAATIRQLALVGKVILMGRGGVSITRDLASGVHIRLVAPRDTRVQRTMGNLGISEKEAARWVDDQDRSRARMVKSRFKQNIDDPLLYDAVWNTDTVPLDAIARYVTEMVRGK